MRQKSYYTVGFNEDELVLNTTGALNDRLRVSKNYYKLEYGEQVARMESKEQLEAGEAFASQGMVSEDAAPYMTRRPAQGRMEAASSIHYDLVGKFVAETGLTRKAVVKILVGLDKNVFDQFADNPEEYIIRATNIINEQKATARKSRSMSYCRGAFISAPPSANITPIGR